MRAMPELIVQVKYHRAVGMRIEFRTKNNILAICLDGEWCHRETFNERNETGNGRYLGWNEITWCFHLRR